MNLAPGQVEELLNIINRNQVIAIGKELGPDFLTLTDKELLAKHNVNVDELYSAELDTVYTSFHFGMLSEALGVAETKGLSYEQLKEYILKGQYIPITFREQVTIDTIKNQTFTDLKKLGSRIFTDVNQVLINNSLKQQRQFIRDEMATGIANRETVTEIAHKIAEKTGDWSRDFERIVAYNSTLAFEEGKAAFIQKTSGEDDPVVYKNVFEGACSHCVNLYLTAGIGSKPRLFKLSQLRANGTNIGRKTKEWLPTLGPIHPYCRCVLNYLPKDNVWDEKAKKFIQGERQIATLKRKPIRIWVGGAEHFV